MVRFEQIHREILTKIDTDGIAVGVDRYMEDRAVYTNLTTEQAVPYWREILDAITRKGNYVGPMSVLMRDDPYLCRDLGAVTDDQIQQARRYRQSLPLNASLVKIILCYERTTAQLSEKLSKDDEWIEIMNLESGCTVKISCSTPMIPGYVVVGDPHMN